MWLEDHFGNFEEIVKILESLGLRIRKVSTQEEFEAAVEEGCENAILDNKIGDRHSVGQRLMDRLSTTSRARLLMFTAYLPTSKDDHSFENTVGGGHAGYIGKRFSDFGSIREFWEKSAQLIYRFFASDDPTTEDWLEETGTNAFAEFQNLTLSQQGDFYRSAAKANKDLLATLWGEGAISVILPDGKSENHRAYFTLEEFPDLEIILDEYEKKGIYPYVYSNEYSFDDTNCHALVRDDSVRSYPRVLLGVDFPQNAFHFDTGADTSIFCESYLNEIGGARLVSKSSFPLVLHGKPHAALKIVLSTYIHNESQTGFPKMEPVEILGLMVDKWQTARMQVQCSEKCGNKETETPNCKYRRNGLIGRDLYSENQLQVLLSFEEPQIAVRRKQ